MKKRIKKINIIFCIFCIFFVSCADENITKESVVEVFFTPTAIASSKVQLIPSPSPTTVPKKESSPILEKSKIKAESSTPYNSKKTYFIATDNDKGGISLYHRLYKLYLMIGLSPSGTNGSFHYSFNINSKLTNKVDFTK